MQRQNTAKPVLISIAVFVMLVVLNAIGALRPLSSVVSLALKPVTTILNIGDNSDLRDENDQLRKQVGELQSEVSKREEAKRENDALRQQLQFTQNNNYRVVGATIISQDPTNYQQFLTIDQGSTKGITKGMTVVSNGLLVGRIIETTATTAKVYLITDYASAVPALTQQSRASGIIEGRRGFGLALTMVPQTDQLQAGDTILTSGFAGEYPKGLVIGVVGEVQRRDADVFQSAIIRPAVDFRKLENLFVITGQQ